MTDLTVTIDQLNVDLTPFHEGPGAIAESAHRVFNSQAVSTSPDTSYDAIEEEDPDMPPLNDPLPRGVVANYTSTNLQLEEVREGVSDLPPLPLPRVIDKGREVFETLEGAIRVSDYPASLISGYYLPVRNSVISVDFRAFDIMKDRVKPEKIDTDKYMLKLLPEFMGLTHASYSFDYALAIGTMTSNNHKLCRKILALSFVIRALKPEFSEACDLLVNLYDKDMNLEYTHINENFFDDYFVGHEPHCGRLSALVRNTLSSLLPIVTVQHTAPPKLLEDVSSVTAAINKVADEGIRINFDRKLLNPIIGLFAISSAGMMVYYGHKLDVKILAITGMGIAMLSEDLNLREYGTQIKSYFDDPARFSPQAGFLTPICAVLWSAVQYVVYGQAASFQNVQNFMLSFEPLLRMEKVTEFIWEGVLNVFVGILETAARIGFPVDALHPYSDLKAYQVRLKDILRGLETGALIPSADITGEIELMSIKIASIVRSQPTTAKGKYAASLMKIAGELGTRMNKSELARSTRPETKALVFAGNAGSGKSTCMGLLTPAIAVLTAPEALRDEVADCPELLAVTLNPTANFLDTVKPWHTVGQMDELFCMKSTPGNPDMSSKMILEFCSQAPVNIEAASLEEKGKIFCHLLVLLGCTNLLEINNNNMGAYTSVSAILRRITAFVVVPIDQLCQNPHDPIEHRRLLDNKALLPGMQVYHWNFYPWNMATGRRAVNADGHDLPCLSAPELLAVIQAQITVARNDNLRVKQVAKAYARQVKEELAAARPFPIPAEVPMVPHMWLPLVGAGLSVMGMGLLVASKYAFNQVRSDGMFRLNDNTWLLPHLKLAFNNPEFEDLYRNNPEFNLLLRHIFLMTTPMSFGADVWERALNNVYKHFLDLREANRNLIIQDPSVTSGAYLEGKTVDEIRFLAEECAINARNNVFAEHKGKFDKVWDFLKSHWLITLVSVTALGVNLSGVIKSMLSTSGIDFAEQGDYDATSLKIAKAKIRRDVRKRNRAIKLKALPKIEPTPPSGVLTTHSGRSSDLSLPTSHLNRNTYSLLMLGTRPLGTIIFISGRDAVMNNHFMLAIESSMLSTPGLVLKLRSQASTAKDLEVCASEIRIVKQITRNGDKVDLVIVRFPENIPKHRDIRQHFISMDDEVFDRASFNTITVLPKNQNREVAICHDVRATLNRGIKHIEHGGVTHSACVYILVNKQSLNGDCGSVTYVETGKGYRAAGILSFGNAATQFITQVLTVQDFEDIPVSNEFVLLPPGHANLDADVNHAPVTDKFTALGDYNGPLSRDRSTSCRSPLAGCLDDLLGPLDLKPSRMTAINTPNGVVVPITKACDVYSDSGSTLPKEFFQKLEDTIFQKMAHSVKPEFSPLDILNNFPLSLENAVYGVEGLYHSIPMNTSVGLYTKHLIPQNHRGTDRSYYFGNGRHDKGVGWQFFYDRMWSIVQAIERGDTVRVVTKMSLKDEVRPTAKVESGSTRAFFVAPVEFQVLIRMCYSSVTSAVTKAGISAGTAIGVNPMTAWPTMAIMLTENSNIIDADYRGFDGSTSPSWMLFAFRVLDRFLFDEPSFNAKVREMIRDNVVFSWVVVRTILYIMFGNNSGNGLTIFLNCIIGKGVWLYCLAIHPLLCDEVGNDLVPHPATHEIDIEDFDVDFASQNSNDFVMGDDLLASLSAAYDDFDTLKFKRIAATIGFNVTNADKTLPENNPRSHLSIGEVTFLKRSFVPDSLFGYLPPLNKQSLQKMIEWTDMSVIERPDVFREVIQDSFYEASLHGREFCDSFTSAVINRIQSCELPEYLPSNVGYDLLIAKVRNGSGIKDYAANEECDLVPHMDSTSTEESFDKPLPKLALDTTGDEVTHPPVPMSLADIMASPFLVYSGTWTTTASIGSSVLPIATGIETDSLITSNAIWASALQNYSLFRGKLVFNLRLNSTPMHQGMLRMSFLPVAQAMNTIAPTYAAMHNWTAAGKSMQPGIYVSATESGCTMEIPYITPSNHYPIVRLATTPLPAYSRGLVDLSVVSPLRTGPEGDTAISYSIFAHFEDVEVTGNLVPQADFPNRCEAAEVALSKVAKCDKPVPLETSYTVSPPVPWYAYFFFLLSLPFLVVVGTVAFVFGYLLGTVRMFRNLIVHTHRFVPHMDGPSKRKSKFSASKVSNTDKEAKGMASTGLISSGLQLASKIAEAVSAVPLLSAVAAPAAFVFEGLSMLASHFGYSKIVALKDTTMVSSQYNRYAASFNGDDSSVPLSMDCRNSTGIGSRGAFTEEDEMSWPFLRKQEAYINYYEWDKTLPVGSVLSPVLPGLATESGAILTAPTNVYMSKNKTAGTQSVGTRTGPPLFYLSALFTQWTGDMIWRMKIICTAFHSGRFLVIFTPRPGAVQPTLLSSQSAMRTIVDVGPDKEVEFRIPYQLPTDYTPMGSASGSVQVRVLTSLVAPENVSSSISILLFVRGADNLEFAVPGVQGTGAVTRPRPFTPQCDLEGVWSPHADTAPGGVPVATGVVFDRASSCVGEIFTSTRQLLLRSSQVFCTSAATALASMWIWPWFISVLRLDTTGLAGPVWGGDVFSYVMCMYAFYKGGMRVQVVATGGLLSAFTDPLGLTDKSPPIKTSPSGNGVATQINWYVDAGCQPTGLHTSSQPGIVTFSCPYYCKTPISLACPDAVGQIPSNFGANEFSLPQGSVSVKGFPTAQVPMISRFAAEDFQAHCYVGCPPILSSSISATGEIEPITFDLDELDISRRM